MAEDESTMEEIQVVENGTAAKEASTEGTDESSSGAAPPTLVSETSKSSPKPATTAQAYTVDTQSRSETHGKLRAYEARRRSAYSSKLESSSLYWRSFRDLLHASVHETARAERLVLGSVKVNQTYAQAMQATYEDIFLDDRGNPVTDSRKQKRLQEQRTLSSPPPIVGLDNSTTTTTTATSSLDEKKNNDTNTTTTTSGSGMLSSLIDSQCIIAKQFGDNASHVSTEIVSEITVLRHELQTQVKEIEELGNAIIAELEIAENEVEEAWDAYYSMAMKVLNNSARHLMNRNSSHGSADNTSPTALASSASEGGGGGTRDGSTTPTNLTTAASAGASGLTTSPTPSTGGGAPGGTGSSTSTVVVENCNDVWVVEMRYRVAVAYQSMAWEKGSSELSKLFSNMKQAECARRVKLREVLIAFLNRQERLFLSLPSIQTPVLKDLVGRQMDRDSIEQTVQNSIRARAQFLQRKEATSGNKSKSKKDGPGLSGDSSSSSVPGAASEGDFTLESPLMSELLCKTKVLEVKRSGMMSNWKTVLAVVTADCFLHLFDLPSGSNHRVQSGSAPEVAFHSLVPAVQVPSAADAGIFGGSGSGSSATASGHASTTPASDSGAAFHHATTKGHSSSWSEHLSPSESLVLPNCTITVGPNQSTFEMTETITNKGASKVFGKNSTRKLMLRAVTREETLEWIAALKAQR
mmetsp:Transcript_4887/g.6907  ORF Transcript_4887/g.6907 Transcript_4887/m.6907 type:complete len:695 (+) Transcript_4887:142-2226(+)